MQMEEEIQVDDLDSVASDVTSGRHGWIDDYMYDKEEIDTMKGQLRPKIRKVERGGGVLCCCRDGHESRSNKFRVNVRRTVHLLNISPRQKALILDRYVALVEQYSNTKKKYTGLYNSTRCITTLCGILTPALVSIQPFFGSDSWTNPMYWTTFSTSFLLALLNGYIAVYKIDKKFASSTKASLELESEGWEYFSLVGRYASTSESEPMPTHGNRFTLFMSRIEDIRKGEFKIEYGGTGSEDNMQRSASIDIKGGAKLARTAKMKDDDKVGAAA